MKFSHSYEARGETYHMSDLPSPLPHTSKLLCPNAIVKIISMAVFFIWNKWLQLLYGIQ